MNQDNIKGMLTPVLNIVFKYVTNGKLIRPKVLDNVKIGFSFKALDLQGLLADKELQAIIEDNKTTQQLTINHGIKDSQWVDKKDNNKVKTINSDFFYVGVDTRKDNKSADDLF